MVVYTVFFFERFQQLLTMCMRQQFIINGQVALFGKVHYSTQVDLEQSQIKLFLNHLGCNDP
jgi:hypothetical protein